MADVIMLAIVCGFFVLSVLFVKACELIIGPDTGITVAESENAPPQQEAA